MNIPQPLSSGKFRIQSIDLLRGAVMIIMAIDHVRVYSGMPAGSPEPAVFLTRWITHYCAPAFAFFAGTSAFLYYQKSGNKRDVASFLFTRGLLLVILEMTVIRFFWTFNFDYANYMLTGVIWMLGWCMIILAAFIRLKPATIGIIGLIIILVQPIFSYVPEIFPASMRDSVVQTWGFFYPTGSRGGVLSGPSGLDNIFGMSILYVLLPWAGVMMAGYGFGKLLIDKPETVKRNCLRIGLTAIILFFVVGIVTIVTNPSAGGELPFILKLLNQRKYPPSLLFLLMTLGPMIALVPWAESVKGKFADAVKIIGRVPMFYYLLHILLIHLSAFIVNLVLSGSIHQEWYETAPLVWVEEDQRWGLPILYFVWVVDVVILYLACRWYAAYKASHPGNKWVKYI